MSTTVQQIHDVVASVMLEPNGFTLGVFTEDQFLHALSVVLLDFSQSAPLDKKIYTQQIQNGISEYVVPEDIMAPELCFVGGRLIEKVTEADLTQGHLDWKAKSGPPQQWHEDNLEVKRVQLFPTPDYNGTARAGEYGDFFPAERNLTIVGPAAPSKTDWTLDDTLDGIDDSFVAYLAYGILQQIFDSESEGRDVQRSAYTRARYQEGVSLASAIAREELLEDGE